VVLVVVDHTGTGTGTRGKGGRPGDGSFQILSCVYTSRSTMQICNAPLNRRVTLHAFLNSGEE